MEQTFKGEKRMKKFMVFALAMTLIMGLASIASAGVTVSGSLRLETTLGFHDSDYSTAASGTGKSYVNWDRFANSWSRLKFRWATKDKKFGSYVEIGVYSPQDGGNVGTRRTEFWYSFGGDILNEIMFGHSWTWGADWFAASNYIPGNPSLSGGYGGPSYGRVEQIRLKLFKRHVLYVYALRPSAGSVWTGGQKFTFLPAFGLAWHLHFGNVTILPWVYYQLAQWENATTSDSFNMVDLGVAINGDFGLVGFTVEGHYGINSRVSTPSGTGSPFLTNNKVQDDVTGFSVWGQLRIGGLYMGGGYAVQSRTDWTNDPAKMAAYVSYKIPFGPMTFRPEIAYFGDGKSTTNVEQGNSFYVGLWTQIDF
jgi:hypothetical protein